MAIEIAKSVATTGFIVLVVTFVLKYFKKTIMNKLLSQIRNIGIITHFMIMQLNYSAI